MATGNPDPNPALLGRDIAEILKFWEEKQSTPGYNPEPIVTRLAEIIEEEIEIYIRRDPDPFDERHPSRTDPNCEIGRLLKTLFRKDNFMIRLVNDYLRENFFTRQNIQQSSETLNIAACRFILVIMPGLETSAVFQSDYDHLITRLYSWAENSSDPLQSYATGLLGAAMEGQDIAVAFRDQNVKFLPIMLNKLRKLQMNDQNIQQNIQQIKIETTSDMDIDMKTENIDKSPSTSKMNIVSSGEPTVHSYLERPFAHLGGGSAPSSPESHAASTNSTSSSILNKFKNTTNLSTIVQSDSSQQNNQDKNGYRYMIPIHPLTPATSQMLILRYLTPIGEYQEFLPIIFEQNVMELIMGYIQNLDAKDTCLAFEALKYLASLLCHKKFSLEFISNGGLDILLKVPRPSMASTGVSIALYYLAYCEDAMVRICQMSQKLVSELVTYGLWLLGSTHDSSRCHATMFFGLSFQFKIMLDEFDKQDGLRKLYNVMAVLPVITQPDQVDLNDDQECAARQIVRNVCVALKRYFESHLYYKYTQITRQHYVSSVGPIQNTVLRAPKNTLEGISEQIKALQELLPMHASWAPVDEFLALGGVNILVRIVAFVYEWNGGRSNSAETVRSSLEILNIACVIPRVPQVFCARSENDEYLQGQIAAGINIILGSAQGEIVGDPEVQKTALYILVHSVCAPIHRHGVTARFGSPKKKCVNNSSEEHLHEIWESVRSNNGIIVLLQLMMIKTPITDADCVRGLACQALAGLARSDTVKQIIGKLPLFINGQIQALIRDPILQEKRVEHVQFQKYAVELMELVLGKTFNQLDATLANIHKANVVAQTKIQFNADQLTQLIYQHLLANGLEETAYTLQREAGLNKKNITTHNAPRIPLSLFAHLNRSPPASVISRLRVRNIISEAHFLAQLPVTPRTPVNAVKHFNNINNNNNDASDGEKSIGNVPIKLIKKLPISSPSANMNGISSASRSLEKPVKITAEPFASTSAASIERTSKINNVSLTTIVTEYLINQHSLCKNPMSTCPQFDLFVPHKCPDAKINRPTNHFVNYATRFFRRQTDGVNSHRLDRRLLHSNFSIARVLRTHSPDAYYSCCDYAPCASRVFVGLNCGNVQVLNINDNTEEYSHNCHTSTVTSTTCSRDGRLLLTSSSWRKPLSYLWNVENKIFTEKMQFNDEEYLEFSNIYQDNVIGTQGSLATLYDIVTGKLVQSMIPTITNNYSRNRATFCPTDELVLSDGVLWDVKSGKEIHKFDKLNQALSGVFHPNGLEIISNSEVWDLRTFHLLRTEPNLKQCMVKFSPLNVMYAMTIDSEVGVDSSTFFYQSSFKTIDFDYSSISTVDVKRCIYDLSVNKCGTQIAVVENNGDYDTVHESTVRVYSVGRKKNIEDEVEEDDDDVDGSDDSSNDSILINESGAVRRLEDEFDNIDDEDEDEDEDEDDVDDDDADDDDINWENFSASSNDFPVDENDWEMYVVQSDPVSEDDDGDEDVVADNNDNGGDNDDSSASQ